MCSKIIVWFWLKAPILMIETLFQSFVHGNQDWESWRTKLPAICVISQARRKVPEVQLVRMNQAGDVQKINIQGDPQLVSRTPFPTSGDPIPFPSRGSHVLGGPWKNAWRSWPNLWLMEDRSADRSERSCFCLSMVGSKNYRYKWGEMG